MRALRATLAGGDELLVCKRLRRCQKNIFLAGWKFTAYCADRHRILFSNQTPGTVLPTLSMTTTFWFIISRSLGISLIDVILLHPLLYYGNRALSLNGSNQVLSIDMVLSRFGYLSRQLWRLIRLNRLHPLPGVIINIKQSWLNDCTLAGTKIFFRPLACEYFPG